ncbi:MAG: serine/threonine protein kinase, partial [Zavarzinella sp.]|nr:serine/threonine protein kinase [Zavarzinella sp.]
ARVAELAARPEAAAGDVASLCAHAEHQGWLTAYQVRELKAGHGRRLAVGAYRIFDRLEDGPGGPTYKALHPALPQPVALKVLRQDWLTPADTPAAYVARLQVASLVQNPHLVMILDAGLVDDGPFVVQELVDGCDLYHLVNEMGALPIELACEYTRQAALALRAAHEKGVTHGEVSPLVLLLTPVKRVTGSSGQTSVRPLPGAVVKLAGLSVTPLRPPIGDLTYGQSDRLGPVAFLAPERLRSGDRTAAGDLYGLGATLYYLLTTRPPHAGQTPADVSLSVQQSEPAPLETLRTGVPAPVAALVGRLLSRDPAGRPSAAEVLEALMPFCEPSAIPLADGPESIVPLANETGTIPAVPTALPASGSGTQAAVGLLPEIQPLESPSDSGRGFGSLGADQSQVLRPRPKATKKHLGWVIAGLILHLTALALLVGYLTNWFAFVRPPEPDGHQVEEKKDVPPKKGKRG